jgi:hypothetical protein
MIKITKAKEIKNKKLNRFLLQIGEYNFHLSFKEAEYLSDRLDVLINAGIEKETREDWSC